MAEREDEAPAKRRRVLLEQQAFQFLALNANLRLQVMSQMPFSDIIAVCSTNKELMAWCDTNQALWNMVLWRNMSPPKVDPLQLDWNRPLAALTVRAIRDIVAPFLGSALIPTAEPSARNLALAWILARRSETGNREVGDMRAATVLSQVGGSRRVQLTLTRVDAKEDARMKYEPVKRYNIQRGTTLSVAYGRSAEMEDFLKPAFDAFFGADYEEEFLTSADLRYFLHSADRTSVTAFFLYLLENGWVPHTYGLGENVPDPSSILNLKSEMLPIGDPIPDFQRLMLFWADVFDYPDWARASTKSAGILRNPNFWRQQMEARQPRGANPGMWPASFANDRRKYIAETAAAYLYRKGTAVRYAHFPLISGNQSAGITLGHREGHPAVSVAYWSPMPDSRPSTAAVRRFIQDWASWSEKDGPLADFFEHALGQEKRANYGLSGGDWTPMIPAIQTIQDRRIVSVAIYLILDQGMRWEEPVGYSPPTGENKNRTRYIRSKLTGGALSVNASPFLDVPRDVKMLILQGLTVFGVEAMQRTPTAMMAPVDSNRLWADVFRSRVSSEDYYEKPPGGTIARWPRALKVYPDMKWRVIAMDSVTYLHTAFNQAQNDAREEAPRARGALEDMQALSDINYGEVGSTITFKDPKGRRVVIHLTLPSGHYEVSYPDKHVDYVVGWFVYQALNIAELDIVGDEDARISHIASWSQMLTRAAIAPKGAARNAVYAEYSYRDDRFNLKSTQRWSHPMNPGARIPLLYQAVGRGAVPVGMEISRFHVLQLIYVMLMQGYSWVEPKEWESEERQQYRRKHPFKQGKWPKKARAVREEISGYF